MNRQSYYRYLFLCGALFGWSASLLFLLADTQLRAMMGMTPSPDQLTWRLFLITIFIFNIGFYWVSTDISKNINIVKLGILAKMAVVTLYGLEIVKGQIPLSVLLFIVPDLILVLLFIEFIIYTAKRDSLT